MGPEQATFRYIEITETLLRLYVFLTQYLDRCLNDAARQGLPEEELQMHLVATRTRLAEMLSVNRVVKGKVEQECQRVLNLGAAWLENGGKGTAFDELRREQAMLKDKTIALSDLLAVFRALETMKEQE